MQKNFKKSDSSTHNFPFHNGPIMKPSITLVIKVKG